MRGFIRERRPNYRDDYYDSYDEESYAAPTSLRMARWLAVGLGVTAGLVAWILVQKAQDLAPVLSFFRDHYPWALLPLTWLAFHLVVWAYLSIGQFFDRLSDAPIYVGAALGLGLAIGATLEWDGQTDLLRAGRDALSGGIWTFGIVVIVGFGTMVVLRRADYTHFEVGDTLAPLSFALLFLFLTPLIYVAGYAAWVELPWATIVKWLSDASLIFYAFVAILILIAIQSPQWRRSWVRQAGFLAGSEAASPLKNGILAGTTLALAVSAVLYQLPELLVDRAGLTAAEYANTITQERRTLLAVMGALGAGITLVYTHLRHQLDRDANATGRYTEAVQQLGSESMSIRLGGIYALARVARDSPGDRQTVTEVLAAFVRDGTRLAATGVALDVMAALTELGKAVDQRSDYEGEWVSVNLRSSNFAGGNLESFQFADGVDMSESNLSGCLLRATSLRQAILVNASLENADFKSAHLWESNMMDVRGAGAIFDHADLSWARAPSADFSQASFEKAELTGVDLEGAVLRGANLTDADLRGADLRGADLTGASLSGARLEHALLYGATVDKGGLNGAKGIKEAISADIRTDLKAQQRYAEWRREWEPARPGHGRSAKLEYAKSYDPSEPRRPWMDH
ncbi:pentapeptide repeat-containing protein [Microbacterium sp. ARD31]|uniref:pentapeptide repeat-containing protein n=1 Tax=Microbacterium sp. ARD31 TaxID=2962576 RepID=UPI0028828B8A|nr:pentapeptide repeat-containing protein [Microbacterium sp. ARD31]MDT0185695.1 pentapeptide repeat-containing protein [Microbacterium sp. ARD31]